MANRRICGGPIEGVVASFTPAEGWTDPTVGDLVVHDADGDYAVSECSDGDAPAGVVRTVSPSGAVVGVELFTSGSIARLPSTGSPSLGQQIQASGATTVKGVASGGKGRIVALGVTAGTVDVVF